MATPRLYCPLTADILYNYQDWRTTNMNKKLDTIQAEIDEIIKKRTEQRKTYATKLANAKTSLRMAKEKRIAMIDAENRAGVRSAIDEEKDALAEITIYQTKLDAIPEKSLIDYSEAERFQDRIFAIHKEKEKEIMKKAKAHIEALDKLAEEYTESANECDRLVKQIRFSLCDDDRYFITNNGKRFSQKPFGSVAGDRFFSQFVSAMQNLYGYAIIRGIDPLQTRNPKDVPIFWGESKRTAPETTEAVSDSSEGDVKVEEQSDK